MSVPSMVHRSGDTLVVRSVVSGDVVFGTTDEDAVDVVSDIIDSKDDLPECKIKRNYSCASCDYFTQNPRHYLYHLRDVHAEKVRIYECPTCSYASKHFQKLLRHAKMVHGSTQGVEMPDYARSKGKKRSHADEADDVDSDLAEDDLENVSEKVYKCSVCSFVARNQNSLDKHEREEHIKTKFFRCSKCSYATHLKPRFTKHVKYHSMPMIKCDMCDFRTPYKWNLDRHCKNHNGRGNFRCSACNFTADIKQSLTVHEMNHHVPPVGQAAGLGVGRRRNKVGASDSTAVEEAAAQVASRIEPEASDVKKSQSTANSKPPAKKPKSLNFPEHHRAYGSDFIDPDDIVSHANGNIYIKNKCRLCNYKSAWDADMAKHEERAHQIIHNNNTIINNAKPAKKNPRPIPNLIPIPSQTSVLKVPPKVKMSSPKPSEPLLSQKDINEICANSSNSELKDLASLFGSEDVFKTPTTKQDAAHAMPDLWPTRSPNKSTTELLKQKNACFFDKLKAKLKTTNLTCQHCGHESKCLTESSSHQNTCGKERTTAPSITPIHNTNSTRCQYCRQRCKSSKDLLTHLQTCPEVTKSPSEPTERAESPEIVIPQDLTDPEPSLENHPMENRVFVWNNFPLTVELEEPQEEYVEEKQEDNVSLDLSIRTRSPCSESSFTVGHEVQQSAVVSEKIPTHGNDISIAQHKRVFKCPHCSFWASTASRFHVHIVGHLNKKPFECSLCSYRSNWRWDITKHIKLKSVRDPAHETAKVLMTDETGRRNYTKYNKYLTEINVGGDHNETSGGSGTRPKLHDLPNQAASAKTELPKLTRAPSSSDFSPLLKNLRPPPELKAANEAFFSKNIAEKKRQGADAKKTLWKCKKCDFRDASREKLLVHVKGHYEHSGGGQNGGEISGNPELDEASVGGGLTRGQAPFRCGHCHQVSNWKHVIQRHCRLKHSGDIRVVIGTKNGPERMEVDEQIDEPDHVDLPQTGTFKCQQCPFSNNDNDEFEQHLEGHTPKVDSISKCHMCNFYVSQREVLHSHLKLHGISDPEDYLLKREKGDNEVTKRYRCVICPYVTNSKSQYSYHKQFHKPRGGQYACQTCGYNVSKRHLLHQHLKVHGLVNQKQNGDVGDLGEVSDEIEEVQGGLEAQNFPDIPLVWVSKGGKFSKMYKCRYCPHVNSRKVNIQEHEKMHGAREKNPNSSKINEIEHKCSDCNYVCNNAGVLSSHSKVHQGMYGRIHCLVDGTKSDDEQIQEMSQLLNPQVMSLEDEEPMDLIEDQDEVINDTILYFCESCPARFTKIDEFRIHLTFHGGRLFYKCDYCTYTARQKPHISAHQNVHTEEYQERTKTLKTLYRTHPDHPQPETYLTASQHGEYIWVVDTNSKNYPDIEAEEVTSKTSKAIVPLSGTDLFLQRNEAQQKQRNDLARANEFSTSTCRTDPQFGSQMHGNPDFIYPTSLKNGRMKEKRYKCHKCPSAFEKREQYKIHLTLHGAKQKYRCDYCDYSVKYYANYSQHIKKHQMNENAQAARKSDQCDEMEEIEDPEPHSDSPVAVMQTLMIEQRKQSSAPSSPKENNDKQLFWCPNCPYTNHRKDAVDNHQKRHISVSGSSNNYTCDHCDYSVPQAHFLRDHTKLHFTGNKITQPEGYMIYDKIKLMSKLDDSDQSEMDDKSENLIFEDKDLDENRFEPPLSNEILRRLNNNDDEKVFVDPRTGETLEKTNNASATPSKVDISDVGLEEDLDSQVASDN